MPASVRCAVIAGALVLAATAASAQPAPVSGGPLRTVQEMFAD